jgi:hypothetical protein
MGADMTKLFFISLEDALTADRIEELGADIEALGDVRLVAIDPLGSYLGGGTDSYKDNEVRAALRPTAILAEKYDVSVVLIGHMTKRDGPALYRMLGSIGFQGLVRNSIAAGEWKGQKAIATAKNNLSEYAPARAYDIFDVDGAGTNTGALRWGKGLVGVDANKLTSHKEDDGAIGRPATERNEAKAFLRDFLADGQPHDVGEVKDYADQEGIAGPTLKRAKKDLGVLSTKADMSGPWMWRLPPESHKTLEEVLA